MSANKGQIAKNVIALYIRMALVLVVGLYTSRVVLNQLGASDFGTYSVVGGIITMMNFMVGALSQGIQRFFNFYKGKNDYVSLNKVFWSGLVVMAITAIIIFILAETLGLWFLNVKMNIPDDRMIAANRVYQFTILTTILSIFLSPYNALIVAHEDFGIYAFLSIGQSLLTLSMTFLLMISPFDKLIFYAFLMFLIQALYAVAIFIITTYRYKLIKPVPHREGEFYKSLLSFSGWNILGVAMFVLGTQGVNIILNLFFGTIVNAARGIAVTVSSHVDQFINNIQQATNPQIVQMYARGEYQEVQLLVEDNFRWNFALYWMIALPLVFEIDYILGIWLGEVPEYTSIFTIIIVLRSLLKCFERPINSVNFAIGKMKPINIFACISVISTTILMWVLFEFGFPPYWAFLIDCLSISLCVTYYMYHAHKYKAFSFRHFLLRIGGPVLLILILSVVCVYILRMAPLTGFLQLIYTIVVSCLITGVLLFFVLFTSKDRQRIIYIVQTKLLHRS